MVTFKDRQLQLREDAIVDAMRDLMVEKGYAGTSMDDVAACLGISKATLYVHFKSKEELALRIIVKQIEDAEASLSALDPALPAIERLEIALRAGIARRVNLGHARIELLPQVVLGSPDFQRAQARVMAANDRLLQQAQQQGAVRADLPVSLLREFISSTFNMPFEQMMKQNGMTSEVLADGLVTLVLNALHADQSSS